MPQAGLEEIMAQRLELFLQPPERVCDHLGILQRIYCNQTIGLRHAGVLEQLVNVCFETGLLSFSHLNLPLSGVLPDQNL